MSKPSKRQIAEDYRLALLDERDRADREYIAKVLAKKNIHGLSLEARLVLLPIPPRP